MSLGLLRALLITDPLVVIATAIYGTLNIVVSFFDPDGRRQIALAQSWARMLLRIVGVRVRVEGIEKISKAGSYIFAPNHVSYMDTPVILANIPVQFRFLAKSELFAIPFIGGHLQRAGHISIPRESRAALRAMSEAGHTIRARQISLLVFPEGGRSVTGELCDFKEGAAYLAIKAGVPLVPIGLTGMHEILPMHSAIMRPGKVILRVGDPIPTAGLSIADRRRLTEQLHDRVAELTGAAAGQRSPVGS